MRPTVSIYTIYRACIWLPIAVPAVLILVANVFGLRLAAGPLVGEVLAYSLIWGGLPYAVLAAWATWWVGGQPEAKIRRLMFRAPLLMVAVFLTLALVAGLILSTGYGLEVLRVYTLVALLGAVVIMLLGYAYVGVAVFLRCIVGPPRKHCLR